jgi:hypothetical protein
MKIFISHSSTDKAIVTLLVQLIEDGMEVGSERIFFSSWPEGIESGEYFRSTIVEELNSATHIISVISPAYEKSAFCRDESVIALARKYANQSIFFALAIPPMESLKLDGLLHGVHVYSIVEVTTFSHIRESLKKAGLAPPSDETKWIRKLSEFLSDIKRLTNQSLCQSFIREQPYSKLADSLRHLHRGEEADVTDLRILTISFAGGLPEFKPMLERLLRNHIRVKILMIDPDQKELLGARNILREDHEAKKKAIASCKEQLLALKGMEKYPGSVPSCRGELEVRKYRCAMPLGFVVVTREWAYLGLYWATKSYSGGPLFEISPGTEAWDNLRLDWEARWAGVLLEPQHLHA